MGDNGLLKEAAMNIKQYLFLLSTLCIFNLNADNSWAIATLQSMTPDQKIGQLLMPAVPCNPDSPTNIDRLFTLNLPADLTKEYAQRMLREYHVGGFLLICEGQMSNQVIAVNELQQLNKELGNVPLLISQDLETRLKRLEDAIKFPANLTLGAIEDNSLIYKVGAYTGYLARRLGVNLVFAPVVDVNNNPNNPVIGDRSFGEDPMAVSKKGIAFMKGIQSARVLACAKHLPGHGDTDTDSHLALPRIPHDIDHLRAIELVPFKNIINAGIKAVMTAHLMVPALDNTYPTSLSKNIITDLLQHALGFKGLIVSDALIMKAIVGYFGNGKAVVQALKAGTDILLFPEDVPEAFEAIKQAIIDGVLIEEEIDQKVLKILQVKESLQLHKQYLVSEKHVVRDVVKDIFLTLKKELFKYAVTLVKHEHGLPLNAQHKIAVVQLGGGQVNAFVQKLQDTGSAVSMYVPTSAQPSVYEQLNTTLTAYKTVVIAVCGMNRFAQQQWGINNDALQFITQLSETHDVHLVLFGSPYALSLFGKQKSIIVAYEDDVDAHAVAADILQGKHTPKGTLPVTASKQFPCGLGLKKLIVKSALE